MRVSNPATDYYRSLVAAPTGIDPRVSNRGEPSHSQSAPEATAKPRVPTEHIVEGEWLGRKSPGGVADGSFQSARVHFRDAANGQNASEGQILQARRAVAAYQGTATLETSPSRAGVSLIDDYA